MQTLTHIHTYIHTYIVQVLTLDDILGMIHFAFDQFNITHTINSLSFGENFPGIKSPLDGAARNVEDRHGMYQYYIKVCMYVCMYVCG